MLARKALVVLARKRALSSVRPEEVAMSVQEEDPSLMACDADPDATGGA